jgi:hypothetical protein
MHEIKHTNTCNKSDASDLISGSLKGGKHDYHL